MTSRASGFLVTVVALVSLGASSVVLGSEDWPHLRGPRYDGTSSETGLSDSWPAKGPPQYWSIELGQGHSGFIAAEGALFTQRQTLGGQFLLCLDPHDGHPIWETRYDWAWQPKGAYPGPYASPTWYKGKVYYNSPAGITGCVDARTGASIWSRNLREEFQGRGCEFGYAATPFVEDDRVVVPVGGPSSSLVALNADTGQTIWTAGSDPASYCPAFPFTFQGKRCVVGYLQNSFILVDAATGKVLYRQAFSTGYDEHSAWPLYSEPDLLLTAPFRAPASCLQLQPGPEEGLLSRPRWVSREMSNDIVSSVLYQGHVYGFDLREAQSSKHRPSRGTFRCLDWTTGNVRWATDRVGHAAVLAADGKLFLLNDSGTLILARAEASAYHELARTQLFADEICWTPPTLWRDRLLVRSPSRGICLYVGLPENQPGGRSVTQQITSVRSWRLDPSWLLSRERDYPNDAPTLDEMERWFAWCVGLAFGGAFLVVGLTQAVAKAFGWRPLGSYTYWTFVFVLGFLGPNVFSALFDQCLFTWPACLYAAFHGTLLACSGVMQALPPRRAGWIARLIILAFLFIAYGYFELCRTVGMFIAWIFLIGFLGAFPFTHIAVRAERQGRSLWIVGVWTLLAFAAYFWSSEGLLLWKTR